MVVRGTPCVDKYPITLDDGNVAGDKALPGVMVTQAAGVLGTFGASCKPEVVEIRTVLGRLFPRVSPKGSLR